MAFYPQFLLFGDSLLEFSSHVTDGFSFAAELQSHFLRRMDVINRGFSGYNTNAALDVLPKIIPRPSCGHVGFLLVLFGANDACLPDSPTKQHVPLQQYKENLRAIVTHELVRAHQPKIILATPPPIDEARLEELDAAKGVFGAFRKASITAQYAETVRQLAAEIGDDLLLLDLWSIVAREVMNKSQNHDRSGPVLGSKDLGSNTALTDLLPDGLHFGSVGYAKFYEMLMFTIDRKWPNSVGSYILPEWRVALGVE